MNQIYISRKKFEEMSKKLSDLKMIDFTKNREEMLNAIQSGGGMHDNASYEYLAMQEKMLLLRINELEQQLTNVIIIDSNQIDTTAVHIGTRILIEEINNKKKFIYIIGGAYESDPDNNKISYLSPLAKGLMGKKVGDSADIKVPSGNYRYKILKIEIADEF